MIIHLNGMPGTGKLTVARILAARLQARLVDNHSIINEVTKTHRHGSAAYVQAVLEATAHLLEQSRESLVFTNALAAELPEDRARFDQIADHARRTDQVFWQILITCDLAENQRRLLQPERGPLHKLGDPEALAKLHRHYTIYHPPATHRLEIDSSQLTAEQTAKLILARLTHE